MSTIEKMMSHYGYLKKKHDDLDKEIERAHNNHELDEVIHKMKKDKLHLKEQMFQIEQQVGIKDGKTILHGNQ